MTRRFFGMLLACLPVGLVSASWYVSPTKHPFELYRRLPDGRYKATGVYVDGSEYKRAAMAEDVK